MHCGDERHFGLCLGYVPAPAYGSCRISDQGTTLRASDLHNAWATILNLFSLSWLNDCRNNNLSIFNKFKQDCQLCYDLHQCYKIIASFKPIRYSKTMYNNCEIYFSPACVEAYIICDKYWTHVRTLSPLKYSSKLHLAWTFVYIKISLHWNIFQHWNVFF